MLDLILRGANLPDGRENHDIAIAAGLGILISSALGAGLMALIFYSNRSGADEAAAQSQRDDRRDQG